MGVPQYLFLSGVFVPELKITQALLALANGPTVTLCLKVLA